MACTGSGQVSLRCFFIARRTPGGAQRGHRGSKSICRQPLQHESRNAAQKSRLLCRRMLQGRRHVCLCRRLHRVQLLAAANDQRRAACYRPLLDGGVEQRSQAMQQRQSTVVCTNSWQPECASDLVERLQTRLITAWNAHAVQTGGAAQHFGWQPPACSYTCLSITMPRQAHLHASQQHEVVKCFRPRVW